MLELGAFDDKDPEIITIENRRRDTVRFNGFFTLRTPEETAADDGYSTHEVPTAGSSLPNRYAEFLNAYDMRTPISIQELEMAMDYPGRSI